VLASRCSSGVASENVCLRVAGLVTMCLRVACSTPGVACIELWCGALRAVWRRTWCGGGLAVWRVARCGAQCVPAQCSLWRNPTSRELIADKVLKNLKP
jgi:hypothetical protein